MRPLQVHLNGTGQARSALENATRSARVLQRSSHETPCVLALTRRVELGSRPAPNTVQPARPHQAANSQATLAGGTALAAKMGMKIFSTAPPAQSHGHLRPGRWSPVSLRRDPRPSRRSAALAFPTSCFSTERSRDHTPGRRCLCDCVGVAVLKKIAARFSFRGLRARVDTIAHATESRGVRRATVGGEREWGEPKFNGQHASSMPGSPVDGARCTVERGARRSHPLSPTLSFDV